MSKTLNFAVASALLFAACGDREAELRQDQQQYEVVQEGAGGPVTGTIHGPGETAPPLMPGLTSTNADTTTAFTLRTGAGATNTAPPGSIAGTLPYDPAYPAPPTRPRPPRPVTQSPPRTAEPSQPVPAPPPPPLPEPTPTTTAQDRDEEEEEDEEREEDPQPQPQPQPPPPPPPPPPPSNT